MAYILSLASILKTILTSRVKTEVRSVRDTILVITSPSRMELD